jgi:hypothetical protein
MSRYVVIKKKAERIERGLAGSGSERSGECASAKISEIDKSRESRRGGRVWRDPRPPKTDDLEFFV